MTVPFAVDAGNALAAARPRSSRRSATMPVAGQGHPMSSIGPVRWFKARISGTRDTAT